MVFKKEQLFRSFTASHKLEIAQMPKTDSTEMTQCTQLDKDEKINSSTVNSPNNRDDLNYEGPKLWRKIVKNWSVISQLLALLVIFTVIWATFYSIIPQYTALNSTIMRIAYLFIGAQISGILVTFIRLPDMLGMLFWGVLYTNIGLANFEGYEGLEAVLREMALVNIMLLAGFGLEFNAFKKVWLIVMQLTFIPTIAEVLIITILAYFLLQMPWIWGVLLGLVITAVSPNVVVTVMLKLKEDRLGLNNGIHTVIYAMTTCNDVVAIFLFGVLNGVIFSTGSLSDQLLQGPVGIGVGIVFGGLYSILVLQLPSDNSKYVNGLRYLMIVLGGMVCVKGSQAIAYPSAGVLGCVTIAFITGTQWKGKITNDKHVNFQVTERLDLTWKFLKPVSFSLIGKECNFSVLNPTLVGYGIIVIIIGCVFRLVASFLSTYGSGKLVWKERAYITISGFPKATVQAALGPIALDTARQLKESDDVIALASNILIVSVIAIIFTAPLGAILMLRLAPIWLKWCPPTPRTSIIEEITNGEITTQANVPAGAVTNTVDPIVVTPNFDPPELSQLDRQLSQVLHSNHKVE
ncbi:sodium/hydrogen exchanger 9B2 isoform X2 [Condylostylus longicornis]|uniref:sodium/hydrogen exchanger 9B2 isoform X2 n=1 Tax=Condylostylus longicornis TaxID=2530218 RepID=UPI00244E377E|nr:sodium/hydrogen exchanger 9B2 isoform X2 [Condylostylus longicornis]